MNDGTSGWEDEVPVRNGNQLQATSAAAARRCSRAPAANGGTSGHEPDWKLWRAPCRTHDEGETAAAHAVSPDHPPGGPDHTAISAAIAPARHSARHPPAESPFYRRPLWCKTRRTPDVSVLTCNGGPAWFRFVPDLTRITMNGRRATQHRGRRGTGARAVRRAATPRRRGWGRKHRWIRGDCQNRSEPTVRSDGAASAATTSKAGHRSNRDSTTDRRGGAHRKGERTERPRPAWMEQDRSISAVSAPRRLLSASNAVRRIVPVPGGWGGSRTRAGRRRYSRRSRATWPRDRGPVAPVDRRTTIRLIPVEAAVDQKPDGDEERAVTIDIPGRAR